MEYCVRCEVEIQWPEGEEPPWADALLRIAQRVAEMEALSVDGASVYRP